MSKSIKFINLFLVVIIILTAFVAFLDNKNTQRLASKPSVILSEKKPEITIAQPSIELESAIKEPVTPTPEITSTPIQTPIPTQKPVQTPIQTPKPTAIPTKSPVAIQKPVTSPKATIQKNASGDSINTGVRHISPTEAKAYVKARALKEFGWSGAEWDALEYIVQKESSWDHCKYYPSKSNCNVPTPTTACGLFQALPCSKMGGVWTSIEVQTNFGLNYIKSRYKTPTGAKAFHLKNNWY